jgi:transposase
MATIRYRRNAKRIIRAAVQPQVEQAADAIRDRAASLTPVDSARLAQSWRAEPTALGARVGTSIWYAPWVEFGSSQKPEVAPLRRAALELGYSIEETGG